MQDRCCLRGHAMTFRLREQFSGILNTQTESLPRDHIFHNMLNTLEHVLPYMKIPFIPCSHMTRFWPLATISQLRLVAVSHGYMPADCLFFACKKNLPIWKNGFTLMTTIHLMTTVKTNIKVRCDHVDASTYVCHDL